MIKHQKLNGWKLTDEDVSQGSDGEAQRPALWGRVLVRLNREVALGVTRCDVLEANHREEQHNHEFLKTGGEGMS